MSDDPKPTTPPDHSAPRRFSRRRLLTSAGATLGAFALGARTASAAGGDPVPGSQGDGSSAASAAGQGPVRFPDGFLWGTASAALHVEGAIKEDRRGKSIWDAFTHTPGKTPNGDTGDIACDEYNLYPKAFDLMAEMGLKLYRLSVAWPRIQPYGRGDINQAGLDHYNQVVDALLDRDIAPLVTTYHWDLPQTLEDEGGWTNRDTAELYAEYANIVYDALSDRVPFFLCLNEPSSQGWLGYGLGAIAPGRTGVAPALQASHHQLLGQGLAVQGMREQNRPETRIGTTIDLSQVLPATESCEDLRAARLYDGTWNRWYMDPIFLGRYPADMLEFFGARTDLSFIREGDLAIISRPLDFFGLNYYTDAVVAADPSSPAQYTTIKPVQPPVRPTPTGFDPPTLGVTATGWKVAPEGLTSVLLRIRNEYTTLPIYITETGAAYRDYMNPAGEVNDPERIAFLDAYLRAASEAIAQGVDLLGLSIWCFQDNFAGPFGYSQKFGLVWTDFVTQEMTPKQSAYWYRDVISRNGLT
jgi:beta-glucosidase